MHRVRTRILALLPLLVGCLSGIAASPAAADSKTARQQTHLTTGTCLVWVVVEVPGNENVDDGPKDTGSGQSCYWGGTKLDGGESIKALSEHLGHSDPTSRCGPTPT